jgi:hypothetical protein
MQKFGEGLWELGLSKWNEVGGIGKRTPKEIAGNYLLAEIESDLFSFF